MWIIDKDHMPEGPPGTNANAATLMGPHDADPGKTDKCTFQFRMYDDDGKLYYEGRCTGISFAPLDDFGEPNAGCTRIDYLEGGKWKTL